MTSTHLPNETDHRHTTQPSQQSQANKRHFEAMARAQASGERFTPQELIESNDIHWTALTAEPRGVDYVEVDAGGAPAMWILPKDRADDRVMLYAHGGGFIGGSIYTHRKLVGHLAKAVGCRALVYEYAYAHEHKHPHQLDTALDVYRWVLDQRVSPEHLALAGDSCGAILTFGTLQRARDARLPLPAAVVAISGWLDLALTGESYASNRDRDAFFTKEGVDWLASNFLGGGADRRDPYASPLYANFKGLPPMLLQAGADETLVDDSRMVAARAKEAGVDVNLEIFPGMLHSFQMMAGRAPEADDAINRVAEWLRPRLGLPAVRRAGDRSLVRSS